MEDYNELERIEEEANRATPLEIAVNVAVIVGIAAFSLLCCGVIIGGLALFAVMLGA